MASTSLASIYNEMGRLEEAENLQVGTLKSMQEIPNIGERHIETTNAMLVMAEIYISLHKWVKARRVLDSAHAIILDRLGKEHPQYHKCERLKLDVRNLDVPDSAEQNVELGLYLTMGMFILSFTCISLVRLVMYTRRK